MSSEIRFPEAFENLSDEPQWLMLLRDNGKPYGPLLEEMIEYGGLSYDERVNLPDKHYTAKTLSERLGQKSGVVNRWIRQIGNDLISLNEARPQLFQTEGEIPCIIFGSFCKKYFCWSCSLPTLPRVGDNFDFGLANILIDVGYFYVYAVHFRRDAGKTRVDIDLVGGVGDTYSVLLEQRANFLKAIDRFNPNYSRDRKVLFELAAGKQYY